MSESDYLETEGQYQVFQWYNIPDNMGISEITQFQLVHHYVTQ